MIIYRGLYRRFCILITTIHTNRLYQLASMLIISFIFPLNKLLYIVLQLALYALVHLYQWIEEHTVVYLMFENE